MDELIENIKAIFKDKMLECRLVMNKNGVVLIQFEPWLNQMEEQIIDAVKKGSIQKFRKVPYLSFCEFQSETKATIESTEKSLERAKAKLVSLKKECPKGMSGNNRASEIAVNEGYIENAERWIEEQKAKENEFAGESK